MPSLLGPAGADIARRLARHRLCRRLAAATLVAGAAWPAAGIAQPADGGAASDTSVAAPEGGGREVAPAHGVYETVVQAPPLPLEQPREDEAATASTITSDRTPRSAESVSQLLAELPGAAVNRLGGLGAIATLSLRGSSSNQVLVYVDGVPVNTSTGGGVDLGALPLGDVDRIEVHRGMSPIGFGASAIGGVVSITTRDARESFLSADAGAGSFGTMSGGVAGALVGGRARIYAGAHAVGSQGDFSYRSDNGTAFDPSDDQTLRRSNNALGQVDGAARLAIPLRGRREVSAWISVFGRGQGVPGLALYQTRESSLRTVRLLGSATYESRDDLGAGGKLRAQMYASVAEQGFHDPLGEVAFVPTESHDRATALGASLRAARPIGSRWRLSGVADGRFDLFQPRDEASGSLSGAPASRMSATAGVEATAWARRLDLDLIPSLRVEVSRDAVSGRDYFGNQVPVAPAVDRAMPVGRLALIQRPARGVAVRANLARYARLPSTTELYGNTGFLIGNRDLTPEAGVNADLGIGAQVGGGGLAAGIDVAGFGALVDDLIQYQQNAQGRARAANIGRARILGVEASTSVRTGRWARLVAQATFTDARDTSNVAANRARQLPLRPRFRSYARPEFRGLPLGARFECGAYADVDVTSGDYLDPANLVAVPSRVVFGAGFHIGTASGRMRFVVSGQNLGDSRIADVAGFPLPGRSVFATLSWSSLTRDEQKQKEESR